MTAGRRSHATLGLARRLNLLTCDASLAGERARHAWRPPGSGTREGRRRVADATSATGVKEVTHAAQDSAQPGDAGGGDDADHLVRRRPVPDAESSAADAGPAIGTDTRNSEGTIGRGDGQEGGRDGQDGGGIHRVLRSPWKDPRGRIRDPDPGPGSTGYAHRDQGGGQGQGLLRSP